MKLFHVIGCCASFFMASSLATGKGDRLYL